MKVLKTFRGGLFMDISKINVKELLSPPDIMRFKRILCIQPHPDDNEIGMGGIIAVLSKAGCEIHYLTVTNGDQGNKNPLATPEETAAIRHAETIAAGKHLGATQFHFLQHPYVKHTPKIFSSRLKVFQAQPVPDALQKKLAELFSIFGKEEPVTLTSNPAIKNNLHGQHLKRKCL